MGFWTKEGPAEPDRNVASQRPQHGDHALPGIAGYEGTGALPKNAMPTVRFNYVRPDGKPS